MAVTCGPAGISPCDGHHPLARCADAMGGSMALSTLVTVIVVAADVHPLQSNGRPHPAIATVVGGVGIGHADEHKAMETAIEDAVTEAAVVVECEPRKSAMGKMGACEMSTAHAAEMATAHAAAEMATATHAAAATAASAAERR